jgi:hypothetical protein
MPAAAGKATAVAVLSVFVRAPGAAGWPGKPSGRMWPTWAITALR